MAVRDYVAKYQADLTGYDLDPAIRETQDLERAQDELARATGTMADRVAADWRDMARDVDRAADAMDRTTDGVQRDTRETFRETGTEAGQEFVQNLGETISSGDLSGLAAGTAGGLASTFGMMGPIGAAFAGLATGASLVFGQIQASAEKLKAAASSAFEDLIGAADQQTKFRNQVTDLFGDFQEGLDTIGRMADATGIPMRDIADALSEGGDRARELQDRIRESIPLVDRQLQNTRGIPRAQLDAILKGRELLELLDKSAEAQDRGKASADRWADAVGNVAAQYKSVEDAIKAANKQDEAMAQRGRDAARARRYQTGKRRE